MSELNFIVRPGRFEDSLRIWEIRNNFLNRQNSNEQGEIAFADHQSWFAKKYFSGLNNKLLVIEMESKVAGYLRFDINKEDGYVASIALNPIYQGRGLGSVLLREGLKQLKIGNQATAQIKKFNPTSLKLFEKCGFKIVREDEKNYYLEYVR